MSSTKRTWDYTRTHWGHNYNMMDDGCYEDGHPWIKIAGWGPFVVSTKFKEIAVDDFIDMRSIKHKTIRYKVTKIEYLDNPTDMFFATLEFQGALTKDGTLTNNESECVRN